MSKNERIRVRRDATLIATSDIDQSVTIANSSSRIVFVDYFKDQQSVSEVVSVGGVVVIDGFIGDVMAYVSPDSPYDSVVDVVKNGKIEHLSRVVSESLTATGMSNEAIAEALASSKAAPSAAGRLMEKLRVGTSNISIFVSSDSTGDSYNEWVSLYATWINERFPQANVIYKRWEDSDEDYVTNRTISGSGSQTVTIYNGARPSMPIFYLTGEYYKPAVLDIPQCDLVIINHGHNHQSYYNSDPYNKDSTYLESIAMFREHHVDAGLIVLTQNPKRDDDTMDNYFASMISVAGKVGGTIADSYNLFLDKNKDPSLYIDNTHPSESGALLHLSAITDLHYPATNLPARDFMSILKEAYVDNGEFINFDGATPDGWSSPSLLCTKDTSTYISKKGYSVKLEVSDANNNPKLEFNLPPGYVEALKGKIVTMAARLFVPSGQATSVGLIGLSTDENGVNSPQVVGAHPQQVNQWHWKFITLYVKQDATYVSVKVYADTARGIGSACYVDKITLCEGSVPCAN